MIITLLGYSKGVEDMCRIVEDIVEKEKREEKGKVTKASTDAIGSFAFVIFNY